MARPITPAEADPEGVQRALRAHQAQLHADNVPWSVVGALVIAVLYVALQWSAIDRPALLAWLGGVALVMAWRTALGLWHRRSPPGRHSDDHWLRHYRANFAAHGLVWAAASALPMPENAPLHLAVLMMVLAGIAASNFVLNAFDLAAALLFGVPAIGALALHLAWHGDALHQVMSASVVTALVFFALTARRASQTVRENVALRLAEARQHHLLRLLIETTTEGYWFIDQDSLTSDVNPAMCQILGAPREALIGRSVYDFVDDDNRRVFQRELARRAAGEGGGYEVTLKRGDGRRIDCYNQATPIFDPVGRRIGSVGLWTDITERKAAERRLRDTSHALQQKSQALEDTLASISQGIVSYDTDGRILSYNQRVLELLDLPEDLMARPGVHMADVEAYQNARGDLSADLEYQDATGQPLPLPLVPARLPDLYLRRTRAGGLVEVRTRLLPGGGKVRTFSDVTGYVEAQRALREREREQRELLEAFPGFIILSDGEHRYRWVSDSFARLIGRPRDQIVGRPAAEVLGPVRFAQVQALVQQARAASPVVVEAEYPATAWRPQTWLQVTHSISRDGVTGAERVYAFGIDIGPRKQAEAALVAARDEAERANRAKSQFLSSMSHELRTPLNAILGFGHLLATDTVHPLAPPQRAQMEQILRGARLLLQLINEVLDLAVVESGSLSVHRQPVLLAPALRDAVRLVQPLAQPRGIHLVTAALPPASAAVQADPVRLSQVLLNLLGNAIKYNHPQGEVRVSCTPDNAPDGRGGWRIDIRDTGPGLSEAQQARLFSAFDRLGAERAGVEGTGLGLALSRGLVRAMDGDIGVTSQPGQGSTFWVRLPVATAAPPTAAEPAPAPAPAEGGGSARTVLYIEDNPVNQLLMEALFDRLHPLRLVQAGSPADGLRLAAELRPDLVLLDIQLPGMDGFELLRRLRQDERTRRIPVIAVSADSMPVTRARGGHAGFDAFLTKPVDLDTLAAALHRAWQA